MPRILVIANRTLGCGELIGELRRRVETATCDMLLLVPADLTSADNAGGLPLAPPHEEDTLELVQRRLASEVNWLKRAGVNVDGEVGSSDPMKAVTDVLSRREFDEVIVSTFPAVPPDGCAWTYPTASDADRSCPSHMWSASSPVDRQAQSSPCRSAGNPIRTGEEIRIDDVSGQGTLAAVHQEPAAFWRVEGPGELTPALGALPHLVHRRYPPRVNTSTSR
jgi:hypothetical protein